LVVVITTGLKVTDVVGVVNNAEVGVIRLVSVVVTEDPDFDIVTVVVTT
jgi:hypothetical protein